LTVVRNSGAVKSCFVFAISGDTLEGKAPRVFRDPVGPQVGGKIADQLRARGFRVTAVKPGKACDAAFGIKFPKFNVTVVLTVTRRAEIVECDVLTWCIKRFWRSVSDGTLSEEWGRVCVVIYETLRQDTDVTSLQWLTEDDWTKREWGQ
jgi:hypothetical protein